MKIIEILKRFFKKTKKETVKETIEEIATIEENTKKEKVHPHQISKQK